MKTWNFTFEVYAFMANGGVARKVKVVGGGVGDVGG